MNLKINTLNIKFDPSALCAAAIAVAASLLVASSAAAQGFAIDADPRLRAGGGRIAVDAYDDEAAELRQDVRHFAYEFGEIPGTPYAVGDPGFNAAVGSGLPAGSQLRFDGVRHLAVWGGGSGAVGFKPVVDGTTLELSLGSAAATFRGDVNATPGFGFVNVASSGALHRHLTSTLLPGANASEPAAGLYMVAVRVAVSGGTLGRSDALYLAYNNGLPEADFARGMEYLVAPTPGDGDFDHDVDFADLLTLARNYQSNADASWFDGDFDRDRDVDFADLLALARHYNSAPRDAALAGATSAAFAADWSLAQTLVPEPTLVLAAGSAGVALVRRRRRSA